MKKKSNLVELSTYNNPHLLCDEITKTFDVTGKSIFGKLSSTQLRGLFFINKGWRLTNEGYLYISKKFISYTSSNDQNKILTGKIILRMDECVNSPWFVRGKEVVVFDPVIHFELQMVNGELSKFVDFKSTKF